MCVNSTHAGPSLSTADVDTVNGPETGLFLDTLAQLATEPDFALNPGTSETAKNTLLKRARAKYLTSAIVLRLVDLPSPLVKSYWNSHHCCSVLEQRFGKVVGKYCKNRWCLVCNRIRTARLIHSYRPLLSTWADKHFLTLTIPNVKREALRLAVKNMHHEFRKIVKSATKRRLRSSGLEAHCTASLLASCAMKLEGLRKFECTYNSSRDDFHPHFHIICKDKDTAVYLRDSWLKRFPSASDKAQDVRKADNNDCLELFKYFTKLVSKNSKSNERLTINPQALDAIFQSIIGVRTFQPFGIRSTEKQLDDLDSGADLPDQIDRETASVLDDVVFTWYQQFSDWISDDGYCLSGYEASDKMKILVEKISAHS